jgi:catechol 2,3-dioxygenase-like lactoylglutathione lyase family enzyme
MTSVRPVIECEQ